MINVGEFNKLRIKKITAVGAVFSVDDSEETEGSENSDLGEIMMPLAALPDAYGVGDELDVFLYWNSDEQLTATLDRPVAQVAEVAWLEVVAVSKAGAFLNWGLPKDLLCPFGEQIEEMKKGQRYLVILFLDDRNRIAASAKLDEFLEDESEGVFAQGQEVSIVIGDTTELGFKAVVNNSHWGVLYNNEVFSALKKGQKRTAYIKNIRDDKRLDLCLQKQGYSKNRIDDLAERVLRELQKQDGFLRLNDKSPPDKIYSLFGVSKKVFKQVIGKLYKQRLIVIEETGIRLI